MDQNKKETVTLTNVQPRNLTTAARLSDIVLLYHGGEHGYQSAKANIHPSAIAVCTAQELLDAYEASKRRDEYCFCATIQYNENGTPSFTFSDPVYPI